MATISQANLVERTLVGPSSMRGPDRCSKLPSAGGGLISAVKTAENQTPACSRRLERREHESGTLERDIDRLG